MNNNDVLRRLRYALNVDDDALGELFRLGGVDASREQLWAWMGRVGEPGTVELNDDTMEAFLDALVLQRRGPPPAHIKPPPTEPLTNNAVLKKLRVALKLRDGQMLDIFAAGGHPLGKAELGGLFRQRGHRHYRDCGNQLLRAFLAGLSKGPPG